MPCLAQNRLPNQRCAPLPNRVLFLDQNTHQRYTTFGVSSNVGTQSFNLLLLLVAPARCLFFLLHGVLLHGRFGVFLNYPLICLCLLVPSVALALYLQTNIGHRPSAVHRPPSPLRASTDDDPSISTKHRRHLMVSLSRCPSFSPPFWQPLVFGPEGYLGFINALPPHLSHRCICGLLRSLPFSAFSPVLLEASCRLLATACC